MPFLKSFTAKKQKDSASHSIVETLKAIVNSIEKNKDDFGIEKIMVKRGPIKKYDWIFIKKDKSKIYVSIKNSSRIDEQGKNASIGTEVSKITDCHEAENHLKESEEKYRKLVTDAYEAVIIINRQGNIEFANNAFFKMTGYKQADLPFLPFSKLAHPDETQAVNNTIRKLFVKKKTAPLCEFKAIDKEGVIKYLSCSSSPLVKNKKITGLQVVMRDITENIKLQQKLEWSKTHYEQVIDSISDSICAINAEMEIISANEAFAAKVNQPVSKLKGRRYEDLIKNYDRSVIKNFSFIDDMEKFLVTPVFTQGKIGEEIFTAEDRHSEPRYYRVRVFPGKNKDNQILQCVITIRDITDSKKAEKELQRLSQLNKEILENAPVSIIALDRKGKIVIVNKLGLDLMGKSYNEAIGGKLTAMENIKNDSILVKMFKTLLKSGQPFYYPNLPYQPQGRRAKSFLNIIGVPLYNNDNKIEGAISMAIDNTESVLAHEKLEILNKELEKKVTERTVMLDRKNKELNKVLELKSQFISDASHELRTPLTIIKGNLDLAMRKVDKNEETYEIYHLINKEIIQMASILSDLTLLTSHDTTNENINYTRVNMSNLIKAAGHSLKVLAAEKNIRIITKKTPKNLTIMGDEDKLEKLLLNLLRNAVKYGREKGWVKIWAEDSTNDINIHIRDNGIGISEKDLPYIFERFYRSDQARIMRESGSGLGLAICKWIVDAHHGYISVASELGKGSLFTVHLLKDFKKSNQADSLF